MRRWNRVIKHFGEVKCEDIKKFTFEFKGNEEYDSHEESCGCLFATWKNNKLEVEFHIPNYNLNPYDRVFYKEITKAVTITWKSGKKDAVYVKAIVYHKNESINGLHN